MASPFLPPPTEPQGHGRLRVFISWSGTRSRAVAEALRGWLPCVIQAVDPWLSAADIGAGGQWIALLSQELKRTDFGIICLTPENITAPWILFEAGALWKGLDTARICPYLFGLDPSALDWPLAQFQGVRADEDGTRQLLDELNRSLPGAQLKSEHLDSIYGHFWRDLENSLARVPSSETAAPPPRDTRDILDELLTLVRELARIHRDSPSQLTPELVEQVQNYARATADDAVSDWMRAYTDAMRREFNWRR